MNYKRIIVFILCVLLAVAAAVPFSGAFASEDNDAPPVDLPTGEENDTEEEAPVTVIEDVADGTVITVGGSEPDAAPAAAPEPEVKTLTDNYVTVTGLLPEDTELQAERISDPFAQPAPKKSGKNLFKSALRLNADTDAAPAADEQSDSAEDSWKAIAFYDIKLVKSGQALQPDGTVTVTIENVPLSGSGQTVSVKHFLDSEDAIRAALRDGSAEPVRDAAYAKAFPAAAAAAEAVTGEQGVVYVETITKADGLRVDGTTVSFPARSFSIYAVGESQPKNRLNVIFHQANSTETISVLVKKDDLADLSAVFVDPGYGTLNAGQYFRGWTEVQNDTAETGMFFDAVCERVRTMLNANNVTDEQTLELWPLIYKIYKVTYKDERGSIIRDDDCVFRDSDPATYTINQDYTPISQDAKFMGWQVESGSLTPGPDQGSGSETYYLNGTEVTLSGDVVLKVYSPSGYWITFEENGKGASYTPPKFVKHNDPTVAPDSNPVRPGYSFGGWYTNQACTDGNEFTFGGTIDEPKTLFAKWIANDTADYTIIIWKQNVKGNGYDFEESLTLNGDVGAIIDKVTAAGTGNAYHAIVDGAEKTYTGFHLNGYDTGVQIAPEGNTVLNVYYDRDVVTLNFYVWGSTTNYNYIETTGNSGTQYGYIDGEYVELTYTGGTWYYNSGQAGYSPTTSDYGTQYGLVNGEYVPLNRSGWGIFGYTWTYVEYTYEATNSTSNNPTQYGLVNGEYVVLTRHVNGNNRYWTYNNNGTEVRYTGQRYYRRSNDRTYTGTRYRYQENALVPYNGIRYTREESRWGLWKTYTGLYGSTLADNGYTWPTDYDWYDGHQTNSSTVSGTRTTFLDAFMPSDGASQQNFYGRTATTSTRQVIFYKQDADLNGYTEANRVQTPVPTGYTTTTFSITDKYNGFKAYQYRVDGGAWQNVGTKNESTGVYGDPVSYTSTLEIRFNRIAPSINYMDGAYFYRAETNLNLPSRGQLKVVEDVNFGSNLSSYNKGGTDYYAPTYDGYVLEGWYTDSSCTQPYTFTTMPEGGITVYAKWVQIEYRVFLHSNVPQDDTSLSWGDDSMCYRASYGEPINDGVMKTGFRQDYEIIGWYTDEACTQPFNFATALTDATVKTDYDKTVDMTDPIDKYGVLGSSPYNSDINGYNGGDRFWITRKLDLYAKWRSKLEGNAKGIHVVYDANGGSGAPTDDTLYLDQADAYAGDKSTPPAGSTDEFKYWIVQQWNGSAFVDTDEHVYAGGIFTVHKANAHEEDIPDSGDGVTKKYTVQLKAFYGPKEEAGKTFIKYDGNGGTLKTGFTPPTGATVDANGGITFADLQINATHTTLPADTYTREGYTFLGWAQSATATAKEFDAEQDVAADNLDPTGNTLYAVWEENQVTLNYVAVGPEGVESGFGSVDPTSETVGAVNGEPDGSTATVLDSTTYRFVGWYSDPECTQLLRPDASYVPAKGEGELWPESGATYYAKFDYNTTTLTISKTGMASGEGAIFTIRGKGYEDGLTVAVRGNNGSVTIANVYIGETYTITEHDSWSWRYSHDSIAGKTLSAESTSNTVSINNTKTKTKWLSGSDCAVNTVNTVSNQ